MEIFKSFFFSCWFIFCSASSIQSQSFFSRFNAGWEQKTKFDKSVDETRNPETYNFVENQVHSRVGQLVLTYNLGKNWDLQSGYGKEPFIMGYAVLGINYIFQIETKFLTCNTVPLRIIYRGLGLRYANMKLMIEPSLGGINYFRIDDGDVGPNSLDSLSEGVSFSFVNLSRSKQEINLTNHFLVADARIQARLEFANVFSIYGGVGYSRGFEPIGKINATYVKPPDTTVKALRKTYYGTQTYWHLGLSLHLRGVLDKTGQKEYVSRPKFSWRN